MMNRPLALACATLLTGAVLSVTASAQPADLIHFSLEPQRGDATKIHASFSDGRDGRRHNNWSTGFLPSELTGLEVSSFRASGSRPLRFAIVREAGRLDCSGNGGGNYATGDCAFTDNAAFTQLLVSRGIGRPDREQAFGLMAVNARREIIDAVAASHYPAPSIDDLMALAALGVDGAYINGMARAGYRPGTIHSLVEFKALGITPEWIGGFVRVGYANMPGDGLVQLRALGVTPDYIAGFQRLGYRDLPVSELVQLKALDITPEFVRATVGQQAVMPPVEKLVEYKMFGRRRDQGSGHPPLHPSASDLGALVEPLAD
jgi:hypothetical protein